MSSEPGTPNGPEDVPHSRGRAFAALMVALVIAAGSIGLYVASRGGSSSRPPSAYRVTLPAKPGGLDSRGLAVLDAKTNLPDGTLVGLYVRSVDAEGPSTSAVMDGRIQIRLANDYCHEVDGQLEGSKWTLRLTIAPELPNYSTGGGSPLPGDDRGPPPSVYSQPADILAILGQHFENLTGDQVEQRGDHYIEVSADYQLPADTCTDEIVYLGNGNFRQVPINP